MICIFLLDNFCRFMRMAGLYFIRIMICYRCYSFTFEVMWSKISSIQPISCSVTVRTYYVNHIEVLSCEDQVMLSSSVSTDTFIITAMKSHNEQFQLTVEVLDVYGNDRNHNISFLLRSYPSYSDQFNRSSLQYRHCYGLLCSITIILMFNITLMQIVSLYRWQTSTIQYDCRSLESNII